MMKKQMLMLAVLAIFAGSAFAMPTEPYRLAFITLPVYQAFETDIAVYNAWMQGEADAAGVGMGSGLGDGDTSWYVIGSTAAVAARDNTSTNPFVDGAGVPIYLTDGTKIADDNWDLWDGNIDNIINTLADGTVTPGHLWVYTGTNSDGTPAGGIMPGPGPLGSPDVQQGFGGSLNEWIYTLSGGGEPSPFPLGLYAMSEVIPGPATMCLLGLGGLLLGRRKKT